MWSSEHEKDEQRCDDLESIDDQSIIDNDFRDDKKIKICRVCGDRALSVNFNVVTCESCKAFFRRNALKPKAFRCPFNGVCEINVVSRKFCKKCRLRKCFEVGMMKEWIMSDEARLKKRELINMNREKRRTVIMATAAKHGIDGDTNGQDSDDNSCIEAPKHFGDDGSYFTSDRSAGDRTCNDCVTQDQLITLPKSALIELIAQCRCSYKDPNYMIDEFVERYLCNKNGQRRFAKDLSLQQTENSIYSSKSPMCDCGLCSEYRVKLPCATQDSIRGLTMSSGAAQIKLPTMNAAQAQAQTTIDEATGGNMLSFLAPSFGKHYHAVEYSLANQNVLTPPRQQQPIQPIKHHPWIESASTLMPSIPLDISPHIYDMVNLPIQRTPTLSCPLPIKLVTNENDDFAKMMANQSIFDPKSIINHKSIIDYHKSMIDHKMLFDQNSIIDPKSITNHKTIIDHKSIFDQHKSPIKIDTDHQQQSMIGDKNTHSIWNQVGSGKLSKLPFTMIPRLQELLEAKKYLLQENDESNVDQSIDACSEKKTNMTGTEAKKANRSDKAKTFFKRITAFDTLLETDQIALLNANHNEISILRQVMLFDAKQNGDTDSQTKPITDDKEIEDARDRYIKVIPKLWRHDDCIMLILMAIVGFNAEGCQPACKSAVEEQQKFYIELLKKYLECLYKSVEVQAAHIALLDIIRDMRLQIN